MFSYTPTHVFMYGCKSNTHECDIKSGMEDRRKIGQRQWWWQRQRRRWKLSLSQRTIYIGFILTTEQQVLHLKGVECIKEKLKMSKYCILQIWLAEEFTSKQNSLVKFTNSHIKSNENQRQVCHKRESCRVYALMFSFIKNSLSSLET